MNDVAYAADDQVDAFFEHFGIKGMKWGVRRNRRQLQAARGKKDWEEVPKNSESQSKPKPKGSADWRAKEQLKGKPIYEMSNAELNKVKSRLDAERNYKQAMALYAKENRTRGQAFTDWAKSTSLDIGKEIGKDLAKRAAQNFIEAQIKKRGIRYLQK